MAPLDPALIKLLSISPSTPSNISSIGGGDSSASASKVAITNEDGTSTQYFLKTGRGSSAALMFAGEHASLNALSTAVGSICPKSFGHGEFVDTPGKFFLLTEFLDSSSGGRSRGKSQGPTSLAQKLAKLHTSPAPIPEGYEAPQFGFPVQTCCGDTAQDNNFSSSWADFYANSRLRFIVREAERNQGKDAELSNMVGELCSRVAPRLIGDDHLNGGEGVTPVVVHGDLWSGNASRGKLPGMAEPEDVVFDSSACYAHSEYELGIMKMFGGFGGEFMNEYHALVPKTEPKEEYEDRIKLYELYHHLNHYAMFGGGYRSGALGIMRSLVEKYGSDERSKQHGVVTRGC
ncbi:fructosamine-3-kinase like protein [Zymoseptoria brevis]|uniref:protein-ribulosamine 3-kinase n=1 Tax=Zymoseptoria brevis TaxID=1047168 RepID=A0A0F4GSL1_9PEZI|nr:fructosamine-3-kinase like protein [Zymoseptoria brevis]